MFSAFVGFCNCKDVKKCRTPLAYKGYSQDRAHVDLNDPKWSTAKFPEANWEPVVTFLKRYHKLVHPSEAFKQLTPNTAW
mmetsp:Transcript_16250/g.39687  ORF Transcript_16250/g.39687 Transcript_16250/m.39687 type:complete len:80 (+) Transcript_16250:1525-1764(+)